MDKKAQIQAAALKLFVNYGFHGTPTSKIAETAQVANGTLFHHYKTKDELVIALYTNVKESLETSIANAINAGDFIIPRFKSTFIHTLNWALSNRDKFYYMRQFETSPHAAQLSAESIEQRATVLTNLFEEGIRKKLLQPHPLALIYTLFNSQVFGLFQYLTSDEFSPDEEKKIINEGYEMIWEMLRYK